MPKKSKPNNQGVPGKEIIERFNNVDEDIKSIKETMATKDDIKFIKEVITNMATKIINVAEDMKSIKETMATKDDIRLLKSDIDSFTGKNKDHENKAIANTERIKIIEPKIADHEKRIGVLESALPLKPWLHRHNNKTLKKTFIIKTEVFNILGKELLELDYPRIFNLVKLNKKNAERKIKAILKEKNWDNTSENIGFACSHLELDLIKMWHDNFDKDLQKLKQKFPLTV